MSERVVILAGGLSAERDISIRSGRRVAEALRDTGLDVDVLDVDSTLLAALTGDPPACVIPLLHGSHGEDGAIAEVLEALGLPYVGSTPASARLAYDKATAKTLIGRAGIATPASVSLPHATFRDLGAGGVLDAIIKRLPLPLVVKPAQGGSALGVSIVRRESELSPAMVGAFAYGETALIESFVEGLEIAVSVVDIGPGHTPLALPAVEIRPDSGFYDYTARYTAGVTEFIVPADLPASVASAVADVALAAHSILGLRDWSRADLIVRNATTTPEIWFLETNVAPGMTETSLLPQAIAAAEMELGLVVRGLTERAITRR
jgi:D-alanine-D-alanine ligase